MSETGDGAQESALNEQLAAAQEKADRFYANWQRSAADFQNWKRRADQERIEAGKQAEAALMGDLLRLVDDFERAFTAIPLELQRLTWIEGVWIIHQKLLGMLQARGLSPIEALDTDFDPFVHEAVLREDDLDPAEQAVVVAELQRGYRFGERVLRPTLVKVGRRSPVAGENTGSDPSATDEVGDSAGTAET
ncbi:MAG: nucleotide exchange factor GrpE [Chloroflexota bacterium]